MERTIKPMERVFDCYDLSSSELFGELIDEYLDKQECNYGSLVSFNIDDYRSCDSKYKRSTPEALSALEATCGKNFRIYFWK